MDSSWNSVPAVTVFVDTRHLHSGIICAFPQGTQVTSEIPCVATYPVTIDPMLQRRCLGQNVYSTIGAR
ncbi:hypothetical protein CC2G_004294 [Coprinopsis cinerea AmutBmut pab1-1]|nr:hypothetical protein CC2G_004294 [Coprinopsis cinerea AmutBmut pab1-1]